MSDATDPTPEVTPKPKKARSATGPDTPMVDVVPDGAPLSFGDKTDGPAVSEIASPLDIPPTPVFDADDAALIKAADAPLPPPPRRSSLLGAVVGGVLAAGAGFGLAQYVPDGWPIADTSAIEARIETTEGEILMLKAELAQLADQPATPPVTDQALADRISALEAAPPPAPDEGLGGRLDAVEAQISALTNLPPAAAGAEPGVAPAALAALQAEIATLKSAQSAAPAAITAEAEVALASLAEAEARASAIATEAAGTIEAASTRAALIQIRAAIDAGEPYAGALTAVPAEISPALSAFAETGLSSLPALQATFPDAARLALEAALRADMGESWTDRVGSFLRSQTGARSLTPRAGTDPDAVLSRAEAALKAADLRTAMTELAALPPEALTAMSLWTTQAQQRLEAQAALAALTKTLGQ